MKSCPARVLHAVGLASPLGFQVDLDLLMTGCSVLTWAPHCTPSAQLDTWQVIWHPELANTTTVIIPLCPHTHVLIVGGPNNGALATYAPNWVDVSIVQLKHLLFALLDTLCGGLEVGATLKPLDLQVKNACPPGQRSAQPQERHDRGGAPPPNGMCALNNLG